MIRNRTVNNNGWKLNNDMVEIIKKHISEWFFRVCIIFNSDARFWTRREGERRRFNGRIVMIYKQELNHYVLHFGRRLSPFYRAKNIRAYLIIEKRAFFGNLLINLREK